jgi:mono/diheme cytochrome c family protein
VPAIVTGSSPTEPQNGETVTGDDDDSAIELTGLPCDLSVLLETSCGECHGTKRPAASQSIATYEDLVAPSKLDPSRTVAQRALARMKSSKNPMPPDGKLGTDEIAILEKWIADGMPKGSCRAPEAKPDAGNSVPKKDAGVHTSDPDPQSVCTSGTTATDGVTGQGMRPGNACISCHTDQNGPSFSVAGTVFPTSHEPDDCNGTDGPTDGVKVLIIDANGAMRALTVNAAGNFMSNTALPTPYRAIVVRGNSIREMKSTQTDGDCNHCHTEWGKSGAPGRVMEP